MAAGTLTTTAGEEEAGGLEEELNSADDDVEDEEDEEGGGGGGGGAGENVIYCQFEKIKRTRDLWKVALRSGNCELYGLSYAFARCDAEFEFAD